MLLTKVQLKSENEHQFRRVREEQTNVPRKLIYGGLRASSNQRIGPSLLRFRRRPDASFQSSDESTRITTTMSF